MANPSGMPKRLTRRQFLGAAGAAVVAPALWPAAGALGKVDRSVGVRFLHGVASGDPLADRVILWTRATLPTSEPVSLAWEVATDPAMQTVVASGRVLADPVNDATVKVDAGGLRPGTTYWYRFRAGRSTSPVGRTRTAPAGSPDSARFAVVTCADYNRGLFSAYGRVAERDDLDAVIHLGDYIYEHGRQDRVRPTVPARECVTVDDYRQRYASYRLDPNLAALHRRHPMIWVWDDHETCDGAWRDGADPKNHGDDATDGTWAARKAAALQAALEWMPVRTVDPTNPERIYRRFAFGDLVDLFMLDTRRIGRDEPIIDAGVVPGTEFFRQEGAFVDRSRQLLGEDQETWLFDGLRSSTARWRFLGNQVVLSHLKVVGLPDATGQAVYANPDQWDGYAPARARLFDVLEELPDAERPPNVVVLTGDVHASMAFEVSRDPADATIYDPVTARGSMAVELVAPSVSSAGDPKPVTEPPSDSDDVVDLVASMNGDALRAANPHLKYVRTQLNGHLLVDVTRDAVTAEFWLVPQVSTPTDEQALDKTFVVRSGSARLVEALPVVGPLPLPG